MVSLDEWMLGVNAELVRGGGLEPARHREGVRT